MRIEDLDRRAPRCRRTAARRFKIFGARLGCNARRRPAAPRPCFTPEHTACRLRCRRAEAPGCGAALRCYCTRREILEATSAPHVIPGSYPGTCRNLSDAERESRREIRPPALRLRAEISEFTVQDMFAGEYTGAVDDVVVRRNDGTYAYNLAVVVDDHYQGVTQVVRGDDLLSSAPRQAYLAALLGYEPPHYAHVPLALNTEGKRLAKRDGAVTLKQLRDAGFVEPDILEWIRASIPHS